MPHIVFIINPISGTGKKDVIEKMIRRHIDRDRYHYSIRRTTHAGHASELTRQAVNDGANIVVAVGGDGTINEVARALIHTSTALGIVPCGSGNGLARHLRIPLDAEAAIQVINRGAIHSLDYGRINGKPFFCTCGVGFDAFISMKFAQAGKRGWVTYVEKTLRDGLTYKPENYHITVEGDEGKAETYEAFLIACANASQYGNNAFIAPHASMKDGLLDVIILESFGILDTPTIVMQLFDKTLHTNSHVKTLRAKRLRIERTQSGAAHCDGEPFNTDQVIDVEIVSGQFKVVVDEEAQLRKEEENYNLLQVFLEPFQAWTPIVELKKTGQQIRKKTEIEIKRLNLKILRSWKKK